MNKIIKFRNESELQYYLELLVFNCNTRAEIPDKLKEIDLCIVGKVYGYDDLIGMVNEIDADRLKVRIKRRQEDYKNGNVIDGLFGRK